MYIYTHIIHVYTRTFGCPGFAEPGFIVYTMYHGHIVCNVHTHVYTVYIVHLVHIVHSVYRVHIIYSVYNVNKMYNVYSVYNMYPVYTVYSVYNVHTYNVYVVCDVYSIYDAKKCAGPSLRGPCGRPRRPLGRAPPRPPHTRRGRPRARPRR